VDRLPAISRRDHVVGKGDNITIESKRRLLSQLNPVVHLYDAAMQIAWAQVQAVGRRRAADSQVARRWRYTVELTMHCTSALAGKLPIEDWRFPMPTWHIHRP
jgi:hypothetical protein